MSIRATTTAVVNNLVGTVWANGIVKTYLCFIWMGSQYLWGLMLGLLRIFSYCFIAAILFCTLSKAFVPLHG